MTEPLPGPNELAPCECCRKNDNPGFKHGGKCVDCTHTPRSHAHAFAEPPVGPDELIDKAARQQERALVEKAARVLGEKHGFMDGRPYHDAQSLAAAGLLADPGLQAELEQVRRYYDGAMKVRMDVEKILDVALGPEEEDGAGMGLAGDVALLADREKAAHAERDRLQARIDDVLEWLEDADGMELTRVGIEALRQKLQGAQPTSPQASPQPQSGEAAMAKPGLVYPAGHIVVEDGEPGPGEPWPDCHHGRPQNNCTECTGLGIPTDTEEPRA